MAAKEEISAGTSSVITNLDRKVFTHHKGKHILQFFFGFVIKCADCLRVLLSKGLNHGKHI